MINLINKKIKLSIKSNKYNLLYYKKYLIVKRKN